MDCARAVTGGQELSFLFDGRDFGNWKQTGNWKISDEAFFCAAVGADRNDLHYSGDRIPGDCEIVFEWKEDTVSNAPAVQNPALDITYGIGVGGRHGGTTYGASMDYHISGISIRLHTRSVHDDVRPDESSFSGFRTIWPSGDFSRPAGKWNQSRIVFAGSHVQMWLNNKKAHDLDVESPENGEQSDDRTFYAMVTREWKDRNSKGLCLTVVAPSNDQVGLERHVRVRSLQVRRLGPSEIADMLHRK